MKDNFYHNHNFYASLYRVTNSVKNNIGPLQRKIKYIDYESKDKDHQLTLETLNNYLVL